jgi:anti-anti-sigma factor
MESVGLPNSTEGSGAGVSRPFAIHVEREAGSVRLALRGELDLASRELFEEQVDALPSGQVRELVLDLRDLTFIDSTGIRLVIELWKQAEQDGFDLSILEGPPHIQRLFALTGLDGALPIEGDANGKVKG